MIKIAFFDVDGTLLRLGHKELSANTAAALRQLHQNGIILIYYVYPIYILGIVQNLIHCIFGAGIEISALFFYNNKPCGLL